MATPAWDWVAPEENTALKDKIAELAEAKLVEAYKITEKMARYDRINEIAAEVNEVLLAEDPGEPGSAIRRACWHRHSG